MILDCLIERGNPADTTSYGPLLARQQKLYNRMPRQVSADGGFALKDDLALAKQYKVKDAVFAKKRGLSVLDMAKSAWVYKVLRNFRAGIEAGISTLKRAFGLNRCTWKGWEGFGRYVWSSIVSSNTSWCWPERNWLRPEIAQDRMQPALPKDYCAQN